MATGVRGRQTSTTSSSEQRRREAADLNRQRAAERQKEKAGSNHIIWKGKFFEKKSGTKSLLSVVPYVVNERFHPDKVPQGTLWYRRPYKRHTVGANNIYMVCPSSFNPRILDIMDTEAARLSKEDYKKNKDLIGELRAREREVYLIYDHDAKDVFLYEDSYAAFGDLIDTRIQNPTRPAQELWAGFYLDGADGMALEVLWVAEDIGQKNLWVKAGTIDFIPREEAPVPDEVWTKSVDLFTVLRQSTTQEIEHEYYESAPEDEEETTQEDQPPFETDEKPAEQEHINVREPIKAVDEGPAFTSEDELSGLDKTGLLKFSQEKGLKDTLGRDIHKRYSRDSESVVYKEVKAAYDKLVELREAVVAGDKGDEPEQVATQGSAIACPFKLVLGKDFNESDYCTDPRCTDKIFEACKAAYDELNKK